MIILYVTFPTLHEVQSVVSHALEKNLCACANIIRSNSIYRWKSSMRNEHEYITLFKTSKKREKSLRALIESLHHYEIPCILAINVKANAAYEKWVEEECAIKPRKRALRGK